LLLVFNAAEYEMNIYLFSYADNKLATADRAKAIAKKQVISSLIVYQKTKPNPTQMLIHHSQVNRYPIFDSDGLNRLKIFSLGPLKRWSVVKNLVTRYVASARIIKVIKLMSDIKCPFDLLYL
jgi:hypothetical protein